MGFVIYEVLPDNQPIPSSIVDAWKNDMSHELILVSTLSLSYLQGLRNCLGLDCSLIGSSGTEIQIRNQGPQRRDFESVFDAAKWIVSCHEKVVQ